MLISRDYSLENLENLALKKMFFALKYIDINSS